MYFLKTRENRKQPLLLETSWINFPKTKGAVLFNFNNNCQSQLVRIISPSTIRKKARKKSKFISKNDVTSFNRTNELRGLMVSSLSYLFSSFSNYKRIRHLKSKNWKSKPTDKKFLIIDNLLLPTLDKISTVNLIQNFGIFQNTNKNTEKKAIKYFNWAEILAFWNSLSYRKSNFLGQ